MPHPLRGETTFFTQGVGILGSIGGLENGDGHRCLPGDLARRVSCGIGEGIHAYLILLGSVGEGAVLGNGNSPPLGLPGNGKGQALAFRVGNFQFSGIFQILIGLQGHILRHRRFVLLAPDGDGHGGAFRYIVFIDGQVADLDRLVGFRIHGSKGHLTDLLCRQDISRTENPAAQLNGAFLLGHLRQANAHYSVLPGEIPGREAIHTAAVHFRGGYRADQTKGAAHRQKQTGKTGLKHGSYLQ